MEKIRDNHRIVKQSVLKNALLFSSIDSNYLSLALQKKNQHTIYVLKKPAPQKQDAILFSTLIHFLDKHRQPIQTIDAYIVIAGPGNFTGLKIGYATVKALAYAWVTLFNNKQANDKNALPFYTVPTLDAFYLTYLWRARISRSLQNVRAECLLLPTGAKNRAYFQLFITTGNRGEASLQPTASVAEGDVAMFFQWLDAWVHKNHHQKITLRFVLCATTTLPFPKNIWKMHHKKITKQFDFFFIQKKMTILKTIHLPSVLQWVGAHPQLYRANLHSTPYYVKSAI